ncbi:MAG: hypothetical protein GY865_03485 [candidate division Zixibacteria bacterium]|nr:hypothetical protein [candidate division Zixibacteria bacterium]
MCQPIIKSYNLTLFLSTITLILLLFFPNISFAERATIAEMDNVCQNWLLLNTYINQSWRNTNNQVVVNIDNIENGDLLLGRIYNLSPNGFIVVPVLKELPPVMAYSDKYSLGPKQEKGMLSLLGEFLFSRMNNFIAAYGDIDAVLATRGVNLPGQQQRDLWNKYSVNQKEFIIELKSGLLNERTESVGPLLSTAWHQRAPYNMYCPLGCYNDQCVVGCVGIAVAQILYYWQWPKNGIGNISYNWIGDDCCTPNSDGEVIYADFSDPYIYDDTPENMAEIAFEAAASFTSVYGICGSGAYMVWGKHPVVYPNTFKYISKIDDRARISYASSDDWYYTIKEEIDVGQPIQYYISQHSMVCDGYRELGGIKFYHMNYGARESLNTWYAIDDLYCNWEGCDYIIERYVFNIKPLWAQPISEDTFGEVPMQVDLDAETEIESDLWIWDFGDGNSDTTDVPVTQHTYQINGMFDVTISFEEDGIIRSNTRSEYIKVTADTLSVSNTFGEVGDPIEITILGNNTIPLNKIIIPLKYSGDLRLHYDSCSILGCRTDEFELDVNSLGSGLLKFELTNGVSDLEPGTGLLLKTYFTIISGTENQTATISIDNIGLVYPLFKHSDYYLEYNPKAKDGFVAYPPIFGDANSDRLINILDVVYIINIVYKDGHDAIPPHVANVNGDQSIDILDIVFLINFIYKGGPAPITN